MTAASARSWKPIRLRFVVYEVDRRLGGQISDLPLLSVSIHQGVTLRSKMTDQEPRADDFDDYKCVEPGDVVINRMRAFEGGAGVSPHRGIVSADYAVLRTFDGLDAHFFHYLLRSRWFIGEMTARLRGIGNAEVANVRTPRINIEDLGNIVIALPPSDEQRAIADYLDAELAAMDLLIWTKWRLIELLQERIDAALMDVIGGSELVRSYDGLRAVAIRRKLARLERPTESDAPMVTAFRDGQVTARVLRRSEGFTESWTEGARLQGVVRGDVVVHGLDGFAGAIGTCEADGACSPVYHVCTVADGGDPHFYGRLLRLLATTGYLGNFATSTRQRAVDFRNWDSFGRIPIPVVDPAEQRRIGEAIRRLAPIRDRVGRFEALVKERREALITAAVTGELQIPGVAA